MLNFELNDSLQLFKRIYSSMFIKFLYKISDVTSKSLVKYTITAFIHLKVGRIKRVRY